MENLVLEYLYYNKGFYLQSSQIISATGCDVLDLANLLASGQIEENDGWYGLNKEAR